MATDDHGLEVLKKSGEEITSGDKSDYFIKNGPVVKDFSGTLSQTLDSTLEFENNHGFAHIGFYIDVPTGGEITFEATFDETNWFSFSIRGIESNIFTSKTSNDANFIGSIVGLKKIRFKTTSAGSADGSISGRFQMQQSTIEGIEHQNDIDLGKNITEVQSSQLTFVGKSEDTEAGNGEAKWQIKRILTQGNTVTTEYAAEGQYNQVWNDRESLFPAIVLNNPASLLFDGSDEYINLGDNYTFGPAIAFSWSFWMKAQNFSSQRAFIAKTSQDANVYGYSFQHDSSGKLFAQMRAPSNLRQHTYSTTLTAGVWYHICFTYAGGSNISGLKAYINGSVESAPSSASTAAWTVTDPLTFAARGNTFYFSGNMNQVSVWNKELSSSEVSEIYNGGSPTDLNDHSAIANILSWWYLNTADNFPTEVDVIDSVNGTLTNMESDDYDDGDVP